MGAGQTEVRAGQATFGNSIVYVADSNTGRVGAYAIPWDRNMSAQGAPQQSNFVRLGMFPARKAAIRK